MARLFALFIAALIFCIKVMLSAKRSNSITDAEIQSRRLRNYPRQAHPELDDIRTHPMTVAALPRTDMDDLIDHAVMPSKQTISLETHGPSEEFLRYFEHHHPCAEGADAMTIIELQLALHHYLPAEQSLRSMSPHLLEPKLRIRYVNAVMKLYIMTGRTEFALDCFTAYQGFAEEYLQSGGNGILSYFDNAASVLALAGDFEEAQRYCQAMRTYIARFQITDMQYLLPDITHVKLLFLQNEMDAAEQAFQDVRFRIENFPRYEHPWNQQFLLDLLDQTRLFAPPTEFEVGEDGGMPTLQI